MIPSFQLSSFLLKKQTDVSISWGTQRNKSELIIWVNGPFKSIGKITIRSLYIMRFNTRHNKGPCVQMTDSCWGLAECCTLCYNNSSPPQEMRIWNQGGLKKACNRRMSTETPGSGQNYLSAPQMKANVSSQLHWKAADRGCTHSCTHTNTHTHTHTQTQTDNASNSTLY